MQLKITITGPQGCGKTLLTALLAEVFSQHGVETAVKSGDGLFGASPRTLKGGRGAVAAFRSGLNTISDLGTDILIVDGKPRR